MDRSEKLRNFTTPGVRESSSASLLSARRNELWNGNLDELSPDSRDLFDDIEEAQGSASGSPYSDGVIQAPPLLLHTPNIAAARSKECLETPAVKYETPASVEREYRPRVGPNAPMNGLRRDKLDTEKRRFMSSTPATLVGTGADRRSSLTPGVRGTLLSESAIQPPKQRGPSQQDNEDDDEEARRLAFVDLSLSTPTLVRSIPPVLEFDGQVETPRNQLFQVLEETDQNDQVDLSRDGAALTAIESPNTNQASSNASVCVVSEEDILVQHNTEVHDLTETSAEQDDMDESERLARQLMAEEQNLLLERLQEQQVAMLRATQDTNEGGEDGEDIALALQLLAQEHEQVQASGALDLEEADDPDEMTYDQLLELGERIGDVKQERWRIDGRQHVEALQVVTLSEGTRDLVLQGQQDLCCLVCQYDFEDGDKLKVMPCKHVFHDECISRWLEDHDTCVTCKHSIQADLAKEL